jgi:hypothetical protein
LLPLLALAWQLYRHRSLPKPNGAFMSAQDMDMATTMAGAIIAVGTVIAIGVHAAIGRKGACGANAVTDMYGELCASAVNALKSKFAKGV